MNTKEAIEFLKNDNGDFYVNDLKKVIELLEQGGADSKELKITKEELKKVWQM